uniref:Uncharacterized protein n=1 Tax=Candidatus Kentrum sp. TUN TaxID=2126343 RepID=A0A451A7H8_9GAMM|nr:MAG: hypothetical protein BECKTUN1418D_GA0071000_11653 [Candidatus Kentron sp. TUN]
MKHKKFCIIYLNSPEFYLHHHLATIRNCSIILLNIKPNLAEPEPGLPTNQNMLALRTKGERGRP